MPLDDSLLFCAMGNEKKNRIKKGVYTKSYKNGGLKIVNIKDFILLINEARSRMRVLTFCAGMNLERSATFPKKSQYKIRRHN
jgi:hypothetical protein